MITLLVMDTKFAVECYFGNRIAVGIIIFVSLHTYCARKHTQHWQHSISVWYVSRFGVWMGSTKNIYVCIIFDIFVVSNTYTLYTAYTGVYTPIT